MSVPVVNLNSGHAMPILGFGTWQSEPGEVGAAIKCALDVGYRHIDCAWVYGNEREIGEALQEKITQGQVKRQDLFLTSKKNEAKDIIPKDDKGNVMYTYIHYVDTWKAMEDLQKEGLVRSIGISNFNEYQMKKIFQNGTIMPAVHQIECHPYLNEESHLKFCKDKGIAVTAYAPLGSPTRPWGRADEPVVLEDPVLKKIAEKYGKSTAHVAIKFQIQRGVITIPKSVKPERIKSNFDVFDFEMTPEELDEIRQINKDWRGLSFDFAGKGHKYWAWHPNYSED